MMMMMIIIIILSYIRCIEISWLLQNRIRNLCHYQIFGNFCIFAVYM